MKLKEKEIKWGKLCQGKTKKHRKRQAMTFDKAYVNGDETRGCTFREKHRVLKPDKN